MSNCTGAPAQEFGLAYVEGTLDEALMNRFEEHYYECSLCHEQVRALLALREELRERSAPSPARAHKRTSIFRIPVFVWTVSLGCLVVIAGVVFYHSHQISNSNPDLAANGNTPATGASTATPSATTPSGSPASASSTTANIKKPIIDASKLADLVLPIYTAHALRGQVPDEHMTAGMAAYKNGDCRKASDELALVKPTSDDSRAAHFYRGLCQLHTGQLNDAQTSLNVVAQAGESPEQEGALYALAQVALAQNNPALARTYLAKTIALQGGLESRARAQDSKLQNLTSSHK